MTLQELNCPSAPGGIVPGPQWVPKSADARVPRTKGHRSEHTVGPSSPSTDSRPGVDNSAGVNEKNPRLSVCPRRSNLVVHGSAVEEVTTRGRGAKGSFPRSGTGGGRTLVRSGPCSRQSFQPQLRPSPSPSRPGPDPRGVARAWPERLLSLHRKRDPDILHGELGSSLTHTRQLRSMDLRGRF